MSSVCNVYFCLVLYTDNFKMLEGMNKLRFTRCKQEYNLFCNELACCRRPRTSGGRVKPGRERDELSRMVRLFVTIDTFLSFLLQPGQ